MCSRNCSTRHLEYGEEVHRRSLHESFPTDLRRELLEEEIGKSAKKSIEDRSTKVSNRCASRIARRKFGSWRKRPSKITARKFSNRSNRHLEVGKEVSKIAPRKFPSDVRRESLDENLEVQKDPASDLAAMSRNMVLIRRHLQQKHSFVKPK